MSTQNTPTVIIVGYGNPLRRDDGAGQELLRHIAAELYHDVTIEPNQLYQFQALSLINVHQLTPELSELLAGYDIAVFADASVEAEQFTVQHFELPCETEAIFHSHGLTPRQLAMLCKLSQLEAELNEIYIMHLPATDMSVGEGITAEMQCHVQSAISWLHQKFVTCFHRIVH